MKKQRHLVLGLMSGSSLDGMDIACCEFVWNGTSLDWKIIAAETIPFSEMWQARLAHLPQQSALDFAKTSTYFGHYTAELVQQFLQKHPLDPDFIAAHGHTIFHDPERRFTVQIGDGAALAALTGYPVINNFRAQDIAINGEGAPLAPIADQYLLPGYDFYLNLGGIANISCNAKGKYVAFDIGGANQILNALAKELSFPYDPEGQLAAKGKEIPELFATANEHPFYQQPYPKSLDNQWTFQQFVQPFLAYEAAPEDKLHTACQQLAFQVNHAAEQIIRQEKLSQEKYRMIVTGGGAHNDFLMDCLRKHCPAIEVVIPEADIIEFKEAALIALMGLLRVENKTNTLHTVTGAKRDTISGAIHQGWKKLL